MADGAPCTTESAVEKELEIIGMSRATLRVPTELNPHFVFQQYRGWKTTLAELLAPVVFLLLLLIIQYAPSSGNNGKSYINRYHAISTKHH